VIKNFLIEQLSTRLKLNKNVVQSFVNKLNSNDIIIMNKNLNPYIDYIKDNYQNANDYILKSSFNELKKNYNVIELQEKNKEIIEQHQDKMTQTVEEHIPEKTLKQARVNVGGIEEQKGEKAEDQGEEYEDAKGEEEGTPLKVKKKKEKSKVYFIENEEEKLKEFFKNTTEGIKDLPKKKEILEQFNAQFGLQNVTLKSNKDINEYFIKTSKKLIDDEPDDMKEQMRNDIEDAIKIAFFKVKGKAFVNKYKGLFVAKNITGSGIKKKKNDRKRFNKRRSQE
jgi:hypothetical protein